MWTMPHYITVSIKNLPDTTTIADIQNRFNALLDRCDPIVGPIVRDVQNGRRATTVTFTIKSKRAFQNTIYGIGERDFLPEGGGSSKIDVRGDFLGLTTLSEDSSGNYAFDMYFVHGLGGHAYNTWSSRPTRHRKSCMWPRDLLPNKFLADGLSGRFLTFGYNADPISRDHIKISIDEAADELLTAIRSERPESCDRPIYFVCHSLGGLVVCQSLVLALWENAGSASPREEYRRTLLKSGKCLVRGITFFGTPFHGSRLANMLAPFVQLARGNKPLIDRLKVKNPDVTTIIEKFNQIRAESGYDIPIVCCYEKSPLGGIDLVTERESALGLFKGNVTTCAIHKDHRAMVQFSSDRDPEFEKIAPKIIDMVRRTLPRGNEYRQMQLQGHDVHTAGTSINDSANIQSFGFQRPTLPGLIKRQHGGTNHQIRALIKEIMATPDEDHLEGIRQPLPGTCDWILRKPLYMQWESASRDAVLFIQGELGWGKSVLARFIIERLFQHNHENALIIYFFCKSLEGRNTPSSIMELILYRLEKKCPGILTKSAKEQLTSMGRRSRLDDLWSLFLTAKRNLRLKIFCIIDGLDECTKNVTVDHDKQSSMMEYLRKVCSLAGDAPEDTASSIAKFLFTSRPTEDISWSTWNQNILMEVQEADILPSVGTMIENDVREFAEQRTLSSGLRSLIEEDLKRKSGPMFHWGASVLEMLRKEAYDLGSRGSITRSLNTFRPEINNVYMEALERIPILERPKAAKIIRILVFARTTLSLDALKHAFAVDPEDPLVSNFEDRIPNTLELIIRTLCVSFIKIQESNVDLSHQSAREFFLQLPTTKWPEFSCSRSETGHLFLAKVCLRYLLIWHNREVSQQELEDHGGELQKALFAKNPFLQYAATFWMDHVQKSGDTIEEHLPLVNEFIKVDRGHYSHWSSAYKSLGQAAPTTKVYLGPPAHMLASCNLVNLLINAEFVDQREPKYRQFRFALSKSSKRQARRPRPGLTLVVDVTAVDAQELTLLHVSAKNGCLDMVKFLLECGSKGKVYDRHGYTPFSLALLEGHREVARTLLESKEAIEVKSKSGATCLHWATYHGMKDIALRLLHDGADRNALAFGDWTPLHVACSQNHIEIVKILLEANADPESRDAEDWRPIHHAAGNGNLDVVELLFSKMSDLDPAPVDNDGWSPLHFAASRGHLAVVNYLLQKKKDIKPNNEGHLPIHIAAWNGHLEVVERVLKEDRNQDARDNYGRTPIFLASRDDHTKVVEFLLVSGADVKIPSKAGLTPLHNAAAKGNVQLVERFLEKGSDPVTQTKECWMPIHSAVMSGSADTLEIFLKRGIDCNVQNCNGFTPLSLAAYQGNLNLVNILLAAGADPHIRDDSERTTVFYSACSGSVAVLERLLNEGVSAVEPDSYGWTPLHRAARYGHVEVLRRLLKEGIQLDALSTSLETPLHVAAQYYHESCVESLIASGANPYLRDSYGRTSMDWAALHPPTFEKMGDWRRDYKRIDDSTQENVLLTTIRNRLARIISLIPDEENRLIMNILRELSQCFLFFKDDNMARIGFQILTYSTVGGGWKFMCDMCFKDISGNMHVCKVCADMGLCDPCMKKYRTAGEVKGCCGHPFLDIVGEEWKKLEPGKVNKKGQTMKEWLEELQKRYDEEDPQVIRLKILVDQLSEILHREIEDSGDISEAVTDS